jgi:hypothetical protein
MLTDTYIATIKNATNYMLRERLRTLEAFWSGQVDIPSETIEKINALRAEMKERGLDPWFV